MSSGLILGKIFNILYQVRKDFVDVFIVYAFFRRKGPREGEKKYGRVSNQDEHLPPIKQ